jgi:hypothetical protein
MMGSPEDAGKGGVNVVNDALKQRNEQLYEPAKALNLGDKQMLYNGAGQSLGSYDIKPSPDAIVGAQTQKRGQDIQVRIAQINDARGRLQIAIDAAQGSEKIALEKQKVALDREANDLTRQWMGGPTAGAPTVVAIREVSK